MEEARLAPSFERMALVQLQGRWKRMSVNVEQAIEEEGIWRIHGMVEMGEYNVETS